jgi:nitrate/nitrite-specific signal transduction histidine kinase
MIVFSGMILILTVGVVCALLYRQVLLPIRQLVDFTEGRRGDSLGDDFPEVSGEIAQLATSFQNMSNRVRELEQELQRNENEASSSDSLS